MKTLIALILSTATSLALAATIGFPEAKAIADRDEASLGEARALLVDAQAHVLGPVLAGCGASTGGKDRTPFVVVMRLDASGRIVETWREGSSPMSVCFEEQVRGKTLVPPPRAPFYTSFEMRFSN